MKKIIAILIFLFTIAYSITSYGTDTNSILEEQEKNLGITEFIQKKLLEM